MDNIRREIYKEIEKEREWQNYVWGGVEHDDVHTPDEWKAIMLDQLDGAMKLSPTKKMYKYRFQLIRVAATAIAAVEAYDRTRKKEL